MATVIFKIFRYDPEADKSYRFDTFNVPYKKGMSVLDGLIYIQDRLDGSLAFRVSCRAGVCGSCAMHINGSYRLACETQVSQVRGHHVSEFIIRPLGHLKLIKDLCVDMDIFWKHYRQIKPYLIPSEPSPDKERPQRMEDRSLLDGLIDCILCGACYASCSVTDTDPDYIGPAALLKVDRFILDTRDNAEGIRLAITQTEEGVFRCHTIFSCRIACPKDLNPTAAISDIKRRIICSTLTKRRTH